MIEKIGHIKNPLTIIAIFAGIAEISGTLVLPLIQPASQELFVRFLMLFPPFLVALFFYVLWHKPHVLYAPSDYTDENNFFRMMGSATVKEIKEKVESEIAEEAANEPAPPPPADEVPPSPDPGNPPSSEPQPRMDEDQAFKQSAQFRYRIGEEKAFTELAKEFPRLTRDIVFNTPSGRIVFDGVSEDAKSITLFEVKVTRSPTLSYVRRYATEFAGRALPVASIGVKPVKLVLTVVYSPEDAEKLPQMPKRIPFGQLEVEIRLIQL